MKRTLVVILLSIVVLFLMSGCADGLDPKIVDSAVGIHKYGFFSGLWHGFIVWFSLIGSIFSHDIAIYGINNTGFWYDFGFLLGAGSFSGGAASTANKKKIVKGNK